MHHVFWKDFRIGYTSHIAPLEAFSLLVTCSTIKPLSHSHSGKYTENVSCDLSEKKIRFRRCSVQSTLRMASLNLCFYILFYIFLLSLFTRITSALFIYDKRTLLDIGHRCTNLLQDTLSTDPFSVLRMDRTAEAGKTKGGGVCFMINKKWCDPRNISILSRSCSPHLEHLSIICRPFYLPREFPSIIATAVYIQPQADTSLALSKLHEELSGYINKHPDACLYHRRGL